MDLKLAGLLIISCLSLVNTQQQTIRVCASLRHQDDCNQLQRGSSAVNCLFVQDAVECAQRIQNGTADFGVLTAENAFHIASMRWQSLVVIKELRHTERARNPYDFQSVAIVRADHVNGLQNLRGMDFCHPGLHQHQRHERWTESFLKHFERQVVPNDCDAGTSPAEIEASSLASHFNAACRPGLWSNIEKQDAELKRKYSKLCELCDNVEQCSYNSSSSPSSHQHALECLRKSTNGVTYVSLKEAKDFFDANAEIINDFKYLCPNSSYQVIENNFDNPCVWRTQPWSVIVSNIENSISLSLQIQRWTQYGSSIWESAINSILSSAGTNQIYLVQNIVGLVDYVNAIRPIPAPIEMCQTTAIWCTHSYEEKEKCDVLKTVALTLGIYPMIECSNPRSDAVSCLSDVRSRKADLVGVDSNYGYLARHIYNLTTALYEETETDKYSSVVAVIKEKDSDRIKSFEDLQGKSACFPEYGGIASIAFINVAKSRGTFKREDCNFGQLLAKYFGDSCMPGAQSVFHDFNSTNPDSLCALCQTQLNVRTTTTERIMPLAGSVEDVEYDDDHTKAPEIEGSDSGGVLLIQPSSATINCAASVTNRFFGTRGALTCLNEVGEVAVMEHQRLIEHAASMNIDPNEFRILCRNGSLANEPGFNVDANCFLTTIVDGEIVVRRDDPKNLGIVNALLSLDVYLQSDPDFKLYNIFNGERDLLFEDSAIGLVAPTNTDELSDAVQNYIKLFQDVENCIAETGSNGASLQVTYTLLLSFTLILFTMVIRN